MDTIVRVDQPDPRARRPAFEPANHSQFHEIAIVIDDLSSVTAPGFAANLCSWIRPFAKDDPVVERHGAWAVPEQASFGAQPKRTENKSGARRDQQRVEPSVSSCLLYTSPSPRD